MTNPCMFIVLIANVLLLWSCAESATPSASLTPQPSPTANPTPYVINGNGESTVEQAHARLQNEGRQTYLLILSSASSDVEGEIYQDLRQRNIRMTTGPDEGIDTHGLFCYPNCVFVPQEEVNALSVEAWVQVLRHEYRHIVQATNNPHMAQDFREPGGQFTPYAAFSEVCADYGLNVALFYRAQERMDQLKLALGESQQSLIDQACNGNKAAYDKVVQAFNQHKGSEQAFVQLFEPYR